MKVHSYFCNIYVLNNNRLISLYCQFAIDENTQSSSQTFLFIIMWPPTKKVKPMNSDSYMTCMPGNIKIF